ncbi:MAG TPA: protein kinase [Gemmatimonadales bacterium]|nr:protein kinase [Gemmatimonadales bacterium]
MPDPTCSRCGTAVPPGARNCQNCGADITGQQGQVATAYVAPTLAVPPDLREALARATIGEYEIKGELGQGGMASVFLAHEIALDRKVAIKVMAPSLASVPGMVERFKREARTAAALSHPHIIPIYAVKEGAGVVFFVMKFVEGRSLESVIRQVGQLPLALAQGLLYQVGQALGHAHRRGVIHRDVKPANVMLDADGWAVVTDFGIAKVAEKQGLTQTGATIGTPSYMSPEQCAAKRELTGASDQYSLGVVAYEMLAGQLPFSAETTVGLLYAHVHEPPPPISELRPDCPPEVADALMRMLEKDPEARWPDVETAVGALGGAPLSHDDPIHAQLVELAGGRSPSPAETIRTPVSPVPPGKAAPRAPTRTSAPPGRRPPTRTAAPLAKGAAAQAAPARRASWVLWAIPAVALVAAGVWWKLGRGTGEVGRGGLGASPESLPTVAAVTPPHQGPETVVVVQRPPVETVKVTAPVVPSQLASPGRSVGGAPPDVSFRMAETRALSNRMRAASAGATPPELAGGDALARTAESLSTAGRPRLATTKLQAAERSWASAEAAANQRPHPQAQTESAPRIPAERLAIEFATAFEEKRIDHLRQAYPGITSQQIDEWNQLFMRAKGLRMRLRATIAQPTGGGEAQSQFDGFYEYQDLNSGANQHQNVSWTATLTDTPSGWRITGLR